MPLKGPQGLVVVNFGHPLTAEQGAEIGRLSGRPIERVIDVPTQLDPGRPFAPQVTRLIGGAGLTSQEWQTLPLLVNLPSFSPATALVLAEIHGLTGYFPTVLRLRQVSGEAPPRFEVAEIVNLQAVRDAARGRR